MTNRNETIYQAIQKRIEVEGITANQACVEAGVKANSYSHWKVSQKKKVAQPAVTFHTIEKTRKPYTKKKAATANTLQGALAILVDISNLKKTLEAMR